MYRLRKTELTYVTNISRQAQRSKAKEEILGNENSLHTSTMKEASFRTTLHSCKVYHSLLLTFISFYFHVLVFVSFYKHPVGTMIWAWRVFRASVHVPGNV